MNSNNSFGPVVFVVAPVIAALAGWVWFLTSSGSIVAFVFALVFTFVAIARIRFRTVLQAGPHPDEDDEG